MRKSIAIATNVFTLILTVASVGVSVFTAANTPARNLTPSSFLSLTNEGFSNGGGGGPDDETSPSKPGRRMRKKLLETEDYERRRALWLERYGSFQALQSTFGTGPFLGDLSPEQTRRLYHTLLPRSLLGLYEMEVMRPEELAPLAYEARIAAKEYARSRCMLTGRMLTVAFDQYRNLRDKGRFVFGPSHMTWDEIWDKYEAQIMEEESSNSTDTDGMPEKSGARRRWWIKKDEDESVTMRTYRRILERSCETNQVFDSLFLKDTTDDDDVSDNLAEISAKLEEDVRMVLLRPKESANMMDKQQKAEKMQRKAREKEERNQRKAGEKEEKARRKLKEKEERAQQKNGEKEVKTQRKAEKKDKKKR